MTNTALTTTSMRKIVAGLPPILTPRDEEAPAPESVRVIQQLTSMSALLRKINSYEQVERSMTLPRDRNVVEKLRMQLELQLLFEAESFFGRRFNDLWGVRAMMSPILRALR